MFNFLVGVVAGIVISTVGFTGIAHVADAGVAKVQAVTKEAVNK
jgi:uncharacterized membrane protein YtjA (UPF0391 family)